MCLGHLIRLQGRLPQLQRVAPLFDVHLLVLHVGWWQSPGQAVQAVRLCNLWTFIVVLPDLALPDLFYQIHCCFTRFGTTEQHGSWREGWSLVQGLWTGWGCHDTVSECMHKSWWWYVCVDFNESMGLKYTNHEHLYLHNHLLSSTRFWCGASIQLLGK